VLPDTAFTGLPVVPAAPPNYYDPAASRLRLALADPPYAFGDTLYPRNVMNAALQEAPMASACSELCAGKCAEDGEVAQQAAALDGVEAANADASAGKYREKLADAVERAVTQLTGAALKWVDAAFGAAEDAGDAAPPDQTDNSEGCGTGGSNGAGKGGPGKGTVARLRANLRRALEEVPDRDEGLLAWLASFGREEEPTAEEVAANLTRWIDANGGKLGDAAAPHLGRARTLMSAAGTLTDAHAAAADRPASVARPQMASALMTARSTLSAPHEDCLQTCIDGCMGSQATKGYPNQPWLPSCAALRVTYTAAASLPGGDLSGDGRFYRLLPFGGTQAADWTAGDVPLLEPVEAEGTLLVGLGGAAPLLTLLFQMTPGPAGWSGDPPAIAWSYRTAGGWTGLEPPDGLQGDGTNGLQNSGIATLGLSGAVPGDDGLYWVRLSVARGADAFPLLSGVAPNAVEAGWVGPGGADTQGHPLPAGTITAAAEPLDGIAAVDQPLPSFGGRPEERGEAFHMWMAERLRHKDRAIQGWDYARLALAASPALWQVAVVPAEAGTAGSVRLVVVPGPATPGVTDTTEPLADPDELGAVADLIRARCSPFVTLTVENPPYVRVKVTAEVVFRDTDTAAAWSGRLNEELVAWLSPWPAPELGPRPSDYYTAYAVAAFIRHRAYVVAVLSLSLSYDPPEALDGWCYLTSALQHDLSGKTAGRTLNAPAPVLALPAPSAAGAAP
ncbi:MAG TPA: baseplate J/gp47 family protein, partial [Azospirillaceae bacterium]|nr:baseplate J/gp47 family protein [Azospirillaceae bacterium]